MMRRLFVIVLLIQVAFPTQAQDPLGRHHAPEEIVYFLDGEFVMFNQPQVLDVNGDGLDDVVFDGGLRSDDVLTSGFPHPQVVLTRTEDGLMENTADQIFPGGVPGFPGGGFQKIVADFNNDEVNDLLFMRTGPELPCDDGSVDCWPGAQNTLFLGNGDGTLTDVTATHMPVYSDFTHGSSVLDFDRDGDLDLWVNNSPGSELYDPPFSYLLSNNGEGQFTLVADLGDIELGYEPIVGKNGILPEGTWFTGDWTLPIDANGDGSMDLFMKMGHFDYSALPDRRFIWKPSILINHEGGRLEPAPAEAFESIGCRISPWAPHPDCRYDDIPLTTGGFTYDLNNDGLDDLVQPHTIIWFDDLGTEVHSYQFLISNGDGTFRNETSERFPGMPITEVIEPAFLHDLDGDGHADMFLSVNRERLEISINDGEGFFRPLATDWFGPAYVKAVLDVDGDGDTDFLEDKVWGVALHKMVVPYGAVLDGDESDDRLIGGAHDNVYRGLEGNDVLDGGLGNDQLDGGPDDDTLIGGKGDDVYVLYLADLFDHDTISDKEGMDTVLFSDFDLDEVTNARQGDNHELILEFVSGGSLTIESHFGGDGFAVERIEASGRLHPIRMTPTFESGGVNDLLDIGQDLIYYMQQLQEHGRGIIGRLSRSRGG